MRDLRLAVIGGGRMGEAIVGGLLSSQTLTPDRVSVSEVSVERRGYLAATFGVHAVESLVEAVDGPYGPADVVLIAVKPQQIDLVAEALGEFLEEDVLVVSIAAGVSTARLESKLGGAHHVVRVMPNQPAFARMAISALSRGRNATADDLEVASELLGAIGKTLVVDEGLQNAVTGVSGSGPAYVYLFADALVTAGKEHGLSEEQASELVVQTIRGAAEMLARGEAPEKLIDAVASPGGTTVAALDVLVRLGFSGIVRDAVAAAVRRAEELGA